MVFIYPSGNSDHKQDHSYKRKRRNRFWVYAIGHPMGALFFQLIDKMSEGNVFVVLFPYGVDLFHFLVSFHFQEDEAFRVVDLLDAVVRHDGDAFFGSDHDQDRFDIGGTAQDIRMIACRMIEVHELRIAVVV